MCTGWAMEQGERDSASEAYNIELDVDDEEGNDVGGNGYSISGLR